MKKLYSVFTLIAFAGSQAFAQNLVNDAGIINIAPTAAITVIGSFSNQNVAAVNNSGILEVAGDFTSQGSSTQAGTGTYRFNGPSMQTLQVDNNLLASAVEIDNPVGLSMVTNVGGVTALKFTNGYIFSSANTLSLDNINGAVAGADSTRFFICGDFGKFKYTGVGAGDTAFYPVGYAIDTYNPLTIVNNGIADNLAVRVFNDVLDGGSQGNSINPASQSLVPRTWVVKEDTQGGTQPTYTFQWSNPALTGAASTYWDNSLSGVFGWHPYLSQNQSTVTPTSPYITTIEYLSPYWPSSSDEEAVVVGYPGYFFYPESVNENAAGAVAIYPNPTTQDSPVMLTTKGLAGKQVNLSIYDNTGRLVYGDNKTVAANGTLQLTKQSFAKGLYLVAVGSGNNRYSTKLLVE